MVFRRLGFAVVGIALLALAPVRGRAQGTGAVIRGRILAADNGRPLRRAQIRATPESGADDRVVSTSADGRYELAGVSGGRYRISVVRSGYLPLGYGQRRPLELPKLLEVTDGSVVDHVDFSLPKMALIAGRITDERGDPIAGVVVLAMRPMYIDGRQQLAADGGFAIRTDDAGQYRIPGLVPGTYVVMATARDTWTAHANGHDEVMGFAPTYFPGTSRVVEARRVSVGYGQRATDTDFSLIPGRTVKVSGTALDSRGRPLTGRSVGLTQSYRGVAGGGGNFSAGNGPVAPDGSFTIKNVPPGEYKMQARGPTSDPGGDDEAAAQTVVVNGVDVEHIRLTTSMGWSITGTITTESGAPPDIPRDRFRLVASVPDATNPRGGPPGGKTQISDDWTFSVADLFGPARLGVKVPDGWAVKAFLQDGRDVTDMPLEKTGAGGLSGLKVILTNRVTRVGGQLTDDRGTAIADGTVIVFTVDSQKWLENSRFVRATRPDAQGVWQIRGLPPGEYYAIGLDYVQEGMWNDPEYLESLRGEAQTVVLPDGGAQTLSLTRSVSK